jgi:hypothetical protein
MSVAAMPGMPGIELSLAVDAIFAEDLRESRASAHISRAKMAKSPTRPPSNIVATIQKAPELVSDARGRCTVALCEDMAGLAPSP